MTTSSSVAAGATDCSGRGDGDRLFGESGSDSLTGGDDGDVLDGGRGNDRLTGGDDGDRFVFRFGRDVITDFRPGSDDDDDDDDDDDATTSSTCGSMPGINSFADIATRPLRHRPAWSGLRLSRSTAPLLLGADRRVRRARPRRRNPDDRDAMARFAVECRRLTLPCRDGRIGGKHMAVIFGTGGSDALQGSDSPDRIRGSADTMSSRVRDGVDLIDAGSGNDVVTGDSGNDVIAGGLRQRRHLAAATATTRSIGDNGNDRHVRRRRQRPHPRRQPATTAWSSDRRTSTRSSELDGDDLLEGGAGNDFFAGGANADTFVYRSGDDAVLDFNPEVDILDLTFDPRSRRLRRRLRPGERGSATIWCSSSLRAT